MRDKSVNHPIDPQEKEQDVNRKFRLFGIYHAFTKGKLPSNKQCDVALNSALTSKFFSSPPEGLSDEGKILVQDLRDILEQAKKLILSKNDGQVLQEFFWEAGRSTSQELKAPDAPVGEEALERDANRALEGLRTLANLLITNGEFRKLLSDATTLLRDMAGDVSQEVSARVRPSEKELSQVGQPEKENVWHEKPAPSKRKQKSQRKKRKSAVKEGPSETTDATAQAAIGSEDVEAGPSAGAERPADRTLGQKTKEYLSEKIPQERREQFIWRLKKMVTEIQGRGDYYQAIDTLITLAEQYAGHTRELAQQGTEAAQEVTSTDSVKVAQAHLRTLIERFANCTSLDNFFESLNNIYRDADQDPELKEWFKQVRTYIRKCLKEQGFAVQEESQSEWDKLHAEGRFLLRERYRDRVDRMADEIKFLVDQFNEDPLNKAFRESVRKLFTDLARDQHGKITVTKHLARDIMDIILPVLFENVRYIPITRIEVADPMVDVVVENLVIESDNLMPNVFELDNDNYFRWGRKTISNKRDNRIMIALSGIQADFRDVSYYIKKKRGFPSLTDVGLMDIFLGGEGFSFKIMASNAQDGDREHFLTVHNVTVTIRNLRIKLKKSEHKVLFKLFKPIMYRVVRPALQRVLERQIYEVFRKCDALAYEVHVEAQRAEETARQNNETVPNAYARYMDAARYRVAERRKQARAAAANRETRVHIAATDQHAIFPDVKLPHHFSDIATWYHDLVHTGDRWESPIFTIGNASASTDIPKPASITRKSHETAENKLRERPQIANGHGQGHSEERLVTSVDGGAATAEGGVTTTKEAFFAREFSGEINRAFEKQKGNASGD